ncbi:MAG TPA: cellulase family glycosylhydrolase [Opitutus sp.]|nr:cellulase family glycosylhydrolase [Opitutus sp.]
MKTLLPLRWSLLALLLCSMRPLAAAEASDGGGHAYTFKRGVNISHWLSQNFNTPYAAPWFGEKDVEWIAKHGFDHVRLAVDVRECLKPDGTLDDATLTPIRDTIAWAKSRGLGVVLDAHFLPGADFNSGGADKRVYTDMALQDKVAALWADLAGRFKDEGPWLRFEILNEPVADENAQLNPFMHHMLAAIRETNPTRIVYVTSNRWSQFGTVGDVVLPDDPNVALTIHNYEPLVFTHQRASWANFDNTLPAVAFPGTVPEYADHLLDKKANHQFGRPGDPLTVAQIDEVFATVAAWVATHRPGLEVYVGEFGVYEPADTQSKKNWLGAIVRNCESRGWGWAVWEYEGGFGVRDEKSGESTAILDGLFGR